MAGIEAGCGQQGRHIREVVPAKEIMTDEKHNPEADHRGVDGLTEVLRLQAEALSRISERMSGLRGNFQKTMPMNPPPGFASQDPGQGLNLPALAGDPALNEDSLPVLNSFKQYLSDERRRARKRNLWLTLGFTVAFSGVLAAIVWLNSERISAIRTDVVEQKARAEKSRQEAAGAIKKVADGVAQASTQTATTLHKDITRNILWAHSVISSNLSSELTGRDVEIDQLKDKVSALEIDNTMLAKQLNELGRRVKAVEADYRDFMERPMQDSQLRDLEAGVAAEAGVTNTPPALLRSPSPLTINSAKFGRQFQLQMPKDQ
jgi:hypothetical protein